MSLDAAFVFSFFLVFVRCSAMLLSSPVFGAQTTPLVIRVFTTLAVSGALTVVLQPKIGAPPKDLYLLAAAVFHEAVAGLLIGMFMSLVLQAAEIAGSLLDMQIGLGMSQVLNPVSGVSSSILAQYKHMLAVVVFLSLNAHHSMLEAFAASYGSMPALSPAALTQGFVGLVGHVSLLALQIAAPVLGVSIVVDGALGLMNKAVPQMNALQVGMPAKTLLGLITLGLALPALASGVSSGVEHGLLALRTMLRF